MIHYFLRSLILLALIIPFLFLSNATAQISGKITDSKTSKPIEGVEVFINNTTIVTSSDANGVFELKCTLTGFLDLVLHKPGYSVFRSSLKNKATGYLL